MVMWHKRDGDALGKAYAVMIACSLLGVGALGALVTRDWMPLLAGVGFVLALGIVSVLISLFWVLALWPLLRLTAILAGKLAHRQKK